MFLDTFCSQLPLFRHLLSAIRQNKGTVRVAHRSFILAWEGGLEVGAVVNDSLNGCQSCE